MNSMKSIELFAGAGGLALGVERAGFDHIGLIEFDKAAAETLKKNRPEWNVIWDDIANILDLPDISKIQEARNGLRKAIRSDYRATPGDPRIGRAGVSFWQCARSPGSGCDLYID